MQESLSCKAFILKDIDYCSIQIAWLPIISLYQNFESIRECAMKVTATIVCIYGILIVLGGVMGFAKGGSSVSLIMGSGFGLALLISSFFISKGKISAQYAALILTFLLDGIFTYRYAKTLHFFPAGFLSLLSLAILIVVALKIRRTLKLR